MDIARGGRIAGFCLLAALLIWAVIKLWPIILPLFLALVLAYILQPAVRGIESLEVSSGAAILIVYAYFFILAAVLAAFCLPILSAQMKSLLELAPKLLTQGEQALSQALEQTDNVLLQGLAQRLLLGAEQAFANKMAAIFDDTAALIALILRSGLYLVLTPFLAFYVLRDKGAARRRIAAWLPVGERRELSRLAGDVDHLLRQFVLGYLLVALAVALLSAAFYWSVGLDYALALGLVMGLADLIPYFGPFIGAVPAVAVALSADTGRAVLTVAGLAVIQQLESIVITPKVMGNKIGLHPLTTILAVLAGGWLFGVLGAILAVPAAAAGLLILSYLWSRIVGAKIT